MFVKEDFNSGLFLIAANAIKPAKKAQSKDLLIIIRLRCDNEFYPPPPFLYRSGVNRKQCVGVYKKILDVLCLRTFLGQRLKSVGKLRR